MSFPEGQCNRGYVSGFVLDDQSLEVLRTVAAEFCGTADGVVSGGMPGALRVLQASPSPAVVVVDLSDRDNPVDDIAVLSTAREPGTVLIAIGTLNDMRLHRDLVANGAQDYLLKPISASQIRDVLSQAQMVGGNCRSSQMSAAFIGVRGGLGCSTLAASVAWQIGEMYNCKTALLDLDIHFGSGALTFDIEPGRALMDAVDGSARVDEDFAKRAAVYVNDNLAVLSAEAPIYQPLPGDGAAFDAITEAVRAAFECVIIDLPRHMLVRQLQILRGVRTVVLISEFTLVATRDTIRIMSWLKAHAPHAKLMIVVVGRVSDQSASETTRSEFEDSIECQVDYVLPFDSGLAVSAGKLGKTLAEIARGTSSASLLTIMTRDVVYSMDTQKIIFGDNSSPRLRIQGVVANAKEMLRMSRQRKMISGQCVG